MAARWNRTIRHLPRYRHIFTVLTKYGFEEVVDSIRRGTKPSSTQARGHFKGHSRPERARMALEELGPTFVKFGQLLSTRADLLSPEYLHELRKLQDAVRPVPFARIRKAIETQLGGTLSDHYRTFEKEPLAAASIAQVHRAETLKGEPVAVKVRRPGVVEAIRDETEILEDLGDLLKSTFAIEETMDPKRLVNEVTSTIRKEADMSNELRNLVRFRRSFKDDPTVHVPKAYPELSAEGMVTMEFIDGIKPSNREKLVAQGYQPEKIARRYARFMLRQIFDQGLFHTDPHPGNIMILPDNVVAILDLGQVARLGSRNQDLLAELVLAIVHQDAETLIHAFEQEEMLTDKTNRSELAWDMEELLDVYHNMPLKDIPFGRMMQQTFTLIRQHHVRPPEAFTLMLKCLITIESLAKGLNPDFQLIEELRPFARRISLKQLDPRELIRKARTTVKDVGGLLQRLPADVSGVLSKIRRGDFQVHVQHQHLETLISTLDKSSNRLSFAMITTGLLIASSMLVSETGTVFGLIDFQTLGVIGYCVAAILGFWTLVSIIRSRRMH
ncbi:MAG: ABC1 kinase family protein [Phycisphaerae bacterium]